MLEPEEVANLIKAAITGAEVMVTDLTGTRDHYSVIVVSDSFEGQMPLAQHRAVNAALKPQLQSGEIHALQLKTLTPSEWETQQS